MSYKLFFSSLMVVSLSLTQAPWAGGRGGKDDDLDKCDKDAKPALKKNADEDEVLISTQVGLEKSFFAPPKADEPTAPDDIDLSETVLAHGEDEDAYEANLGKKDDQAPSNDEDAETFKVDAPFQCVEDAQEEPAACFITSTLTVTTAPLVNPNTTKSPKVKRRRLIRVTKSPRMDESTSPYTLPPKRLKALMAPQAVYTADTQETQGSAPFTIESFITGKYAHLGHHPGMTSLVPKTPQETHSVPSDSDNDLDREALGVLFGDAPLPGDTRASIDAAESLFTATTHAVLSHFVEARASQENESDEGESSDSDDGAPLMKRRPDSPYPRDTYDSDAETSSGSTTSDSESGEDSSDVSSWDESEDDIAEAISVKSDSDTDQSTWDDTFIHPTSVTQRRMPSMNALAPHNQLSLFPINPEFIASIQRCVSILNWAKVNHSDARFEQTLISVIPKIQNTSDLESSDITSNFTIDSEEMPFPVTLKPQKPATIQGSPSSFGDGISLRPHYGKTTPAKITITMPVKKTSPAKADFSKRVDDFKDIAWPQAGFLRDLSFANHHRVPLFEDCYYKVYLGNKTKTLSGKELHTLGRKTCHHLHLEAVYDGLTPLWTGPVHTPRAGAHAFSIQHPVLKHFFGEAVENPHAARRVAVITPDAFLALSRGARVAYDPTTPKGFALARKNHAAVNFLTYVKQHAHHAVDVAWVKHRKTLVYKAS